MLGPHITGGSPVMERMSSSSACASARRSSSGTASKNTSTSAEVGTIFRFGAMAASYSPFLIQREVLTLVTPALNVRVAGPSDVVADPRVGATRVDLRCRTTRGIVPAGRVLYRRVVRRCVESPSPKWDVDGFVAVRGSLLHGRSWVEAVVVPVSVEQPAFGVEVASVGSDQQVGDLVQPRSVGLVHCAVGFADAPAAVPQQEFVTEAVGDFDDDLVEQEERPSEAWDLWTDAVSRGIDRAAPVAGPRLSGCDEPRAVERRRRDVHRCRQRRARCVDLGVEPHPPIVEPGLDDDVVVVPAVEEVAAEPDPCPGRDPVGAQCSDAEQAVVTAAALYAIGDVAR